MFWRVKESEIVSSVHSKNIIPANIVFGLSILARSTGSIMFMFTGVMFVKKTIARSDRFFKIFKYIFYTWCSLIIILLPIAMVTLWKPYVMHCETKLDRTDAVNKWCLVDIPNVYNYVQKIYW